MKRITGLLMLALAIACAANATTLTGTIKKPDGTNLTGRLRLTLSHPARSISAGAIVTPQPVNISVTSGVLTGTPTVYGNDDLQPENTYYWAQYYTASGTLLMQNAFYIAGASFDIGSATPTTITTSNISYADVAGAADALRADLASTTAVKGDALIAYKASGTGAYDSSVHAHLADGPVRVTDYLPATQPDGSTDNTAGVQAAVNAAIAQGKALHMPGKAYAYRVTGITIATGEDYKVVEIYGDGDTSGYGEDASSRYGTRIKCTAAATDCIAAVSTASGGMPKYIFRNMTIIGPDTPSPRTTTSGNGINISGTSGPSLSLSNVSVGYFYGSGKSAILLGNVYNATLTNVRAEYSDRGITVSNESNVFHGVNIAVRLNASYGLYIDGSGGGQFFGTVESNEKTGIRFAGGTSLNWQFQTWQENNNTTHTSGESGIVIKPDAVGGSVVRDVEFINTRFNIGVGGSSSDEAPIIYGDATHPVIGVSFIGGYFAGINTPGPAFNLHGNVQNTYIRSNDALTEASIAKTAVAGTQPIYTVLHAQNGYTMYGVNQINVNQTAADGDPGSDINLKTRISIADYVATNDALKTLVQTYTGNDVTLGPLFFSIKARPSATGASRLIEISGGDYEAFRTIYLPGPLRVGVTPTFSDNAAALAGGKVAGDIYRTSTGQLMVVY